MRVRPCHPIRSGAVCAISALICALIAASAAPARADDHEVVFALKETQLHKRPGEAAPVVGHADEGDELEVLGDQGRWLHVRNGKQTGWLTRTEVSTTKPAEPRPHAERSGFAGAPVTDALKVTIAIDRVRGYDDPRTKGKAVLDLVRGDVVAVLGRGYDGWLLVEPNDSQPGWIPESAVKDAGKFAGDPRLAPAKAQTTAAVAPAKAAETAEPATTERATVKTVAPVAVTERSAPTQSRPLLNVALLAAAGAQTFKMRQSGASPGISIATGALATIDAQAQMRVRGRIWAGVNATVGIGTADLTYNASGVASPSMSTQELAIDASAELGLGRMPYVAVRAGVHYTTFSVDTDRQDPMLLGERIAGVTAGLGGALPIWRRLVLSATLDVMPAGTQELDKLPAGTLYATTVRGLWAQTTLALPLPAHLVAALTYRFGALSADLTDNAAMPRTATRTDLSHVITAGAGVTW